MIRLGLTGGIGMGKSTAANLLVSRGAKVSDSDQLARELVEPGEPALVEIVKLFGSGVLQKDGSLDRDIVGELVFSDPVALKSLEGILHPRIREIRQGQFNGWESLGVRLGVAVVPLLCEASMESEFDKVVCVACSSSIQKERLRGRGWSEDQINRRIRAQITVEEKMHRSDYVIWSDGPIDAHAVQWDALLSSWDSEG